MKTPSGTLRTMTRLLSVLSISAALAACGGGGGTTSSLSPGAPAGPATLEIAIAAAPTTGPSAAPVTVAGGTVPTAEPGFQWTEHVTDPGPTIEHVFMDVVKVSLMPSGEAFESEEMEGDMHAGPSPDPSSSPDKPHFVTIVPDSPIRIDLLKLDNGKRLARYLNKFDQVPAGTYDKIRVHYRNVRVVLSNNDNVYFHPTANSKFDIHFRQGHELVIPATTDTTQQPDGWVKFFRVNLDVVGLKLRIVNGGKNWDKAKVILRPQIFAEFVPPIRYSVAGNATIKSKTGVSGIFDISFGTGPGYPRIIRAAFGNDTAWAYSDNVLGRSPWTVDVLNTTAVPAFQDCAVVMAVGPFETSSPVLQATYIVFSFPDVRRGTADNVWIRSDTAFIVRGEVDNVVVIPKPDRLSAYYDNSTSPHKPLSYAAIDNGTLVKARGYFDIPGKELGAYWISIGP